MDASLCTQSEGHSQQSVFGVCLEISCQDHPLVCRLCSFEQHQGHLIVTYDYFKQSEVNFKTADLSKEICKTFGREQKKIHKSVLQTCQQLAKEGGRMFNKFKYNQHQFLEIFSRSFKKRRMSEMVKYLTNSKSSPPQLTKQYLEMLRVFYFTGSYQLDSIKHGGNLMMTHLTSKIQKAQFEVKDIIDNLEKSINNYNLFELNNEDEIKMQENPQAIVHSQSQEKEKEGGRMMMSENDQIDPQALMRRRLLKKYNLSRNQCFQFQRVILRETKDCQINFLVPYIDPTRIKELTLVNTATTLVIDKNSADHIAKMVNLKSLRLFWVRDITDVAVCTMLKYLTVLQELCLCDFDSCTPLLINCMQFNNPCLRKVCFSMDMLHFVRFAEESLEFLPDIAYHYESEELWINLATGLNDLTTLELHHPENQGFWTKFFNKKSSQLTELTLSNIDQTQDSSQTRYNKNFSYTPLINALETCTNLRCLRFQQTFFDEKSLCKVIKKNPKLQTFITNECQAITGACLLTLAQYAHNIEELSIQMNDQIQAEHFKKMTTLKTLVIRGCWGIKEVEFVQTLSHLTNLKCLVLDFNHHWVTVKTIRAINQLKNIKVLNISGCGLSSHDIKQLTHPKIQTLICYNNELSFMDLINLPCAPTLKKLSIGKDKKINEPNYFDRINMTILVQNFPSLTHLKLKGFKQIIPEYLELLPRFMCLSIIEAQGQGIQLIKKFCKEHDIFFNENLK